MQIQRRGAGLGRAKLLGHHGLQLLDLAFQHLDLGIGRRIDGLGLAERVPQFGQLFLLGRLRRALDALHLAGRVEDLDQPLALGLERRDFAVGLGDAFLQDALLAQPVGLAIGQRVGIEGLELDQLGRDRRHVRVQPVHFLLKEVLGLPGAAGAAFDILALDDGHVFVHHRRRPLA